MELKQGLVSTFTDSFITQLVNIHNKYALMEHKDKDSIESPGLQFVEALVRRIKRLLQFTFVE